jgi:hypothetical protein
LLVHVGMQNDLPVFGALTKNAATALNLREQTAVLRGKPDLGDLGPFLGVETGGRLKGSSRASFR